MSVGTTFKKQLGEKGIIFCSFTEAVQEHPDLVRRYLGSVVPSSDNFFAALNSAVFSDGSFCYVPKGVRCPMELSTYFRINAKDTGQFERTLIVADGKLLVLGEREVPSRQIGELVIGEYVEIGANCTIDRGALDRTVIGAGTKLDNLIHIGHNVTVGANVVIAAQTGVSGSVDIGEGAVVGGQVGIGDHATVEPGVILGSGSGVLSNKIVRGRGVVFWGRPARPLREYLKQLAALARLARGSEKDS